MTNCMAQSVLALLLLCSLPLLAQKKTSAPAIRFQGAPQYTQQELLAAAGFKPDARLNLREVKAHAKQLNDTGLFKEVKFTSSSRTLLFTLTPSSQFFPHAPGQSASYAGQGTRRQAARALSALSRPLASQRLLLEGIRQTFEEMLAAVGVRATVKAAVTSGLGPQKLTAMNFTIVSPAVHIGRIQLAGISPVMQAKASLLAIGQTGNSFDTENTVIGLQRAF